MSIRRRLFVLGGLTLVPIFAAGAWNAWNTHAARENEVRAAVAGEARSVAAEIERLLEASRSLVVTVASLPPVRNDDWATCAELVTILRPIHPGIVTIGVTDREGTVRCASDQPPGAALPTVADRPYFRRALTGSGHVVGGYVHGRQSGTHVIHVATARLGPDNTPAGVVLTAIGLDWLAARQAGRRRHPDDVVAVMDGDGVLLVRQPDHAGFVGQQLPDHLRSRLETLTTGMVIDEASPLDGIRRQVGYAQLGTPSDRLFVAVGVGRDAAFADIRAATSNALGASLLALVIAFGLAWFTARNLIALPLRTILSAARGLAGGDLSRRIPTGGRGEFADMSQAFNLVADRLTAEIHGKDLLLRELSHRVMNSLQMLVSIILLQQRGTKDAVARDQLGQVASRVLAIATAYQQLHRIEGQEVIDVGELVAAVARETGQSLLADPSRCRITVEPLPIKPEQAMRCGLIANELVTNAIKYGGGPEAEVELSLRRTDGWAVLEVRNAMVGSAGEPRGGFGSRMVALLATDLGGTLNMHHAEGFVTAELRFPLAEAG